MSTGSKQIQKTLFTLLAGYTVLPELQILLAKEQVPPAFGEGTTARAIANLTGGNYAYLNVALRHLTAAGVLRRETPSTSASHTFTDAGRILAGNLPQFRELQLKQAALPPMDELLFGSPGADATRLFAGLAHSSSEGWGVSANGFANSGLFQSRLTNYMNGQTVPEVLVSLKANGLLDRIGADGVRLGSLDCNPETTAAAMKLLTTQGWARFDDGRVFLTPDGEYIRSVAWSCGVTVSYKPVISYLNRLLYGDAKFPREVGGREVLVDRDTNVKGSGYTHSHYFPFLDAIMKYLFDELPLDKQPRGWCDTGCGDGQLLVYAWNYIRQHTNRGKNLERYPLTLVANDISKVALEITERNLLAAGITDYRLISSDIGRPDLLEVILGELHFDIRQFIHSRTFLDHNRRFVYPQGYVPGTRPTRTSGAFCSMGESIPGDVLEENLVRHFAGWAKYADPFGLIVIELHTLSPEVTVQNLETTLALPYDFTHGYSDQYLVEIPVFDACLQEARLAHSPELRVVFKRSEPAIATVSIDLLRAA